MTKFDQGPKWFAIPKKSTCRDYLSNGYLNSLSNFNYKKVTKFCMHSYLPNGHLNLWSYLNSKKLVKRETLSCTFAKVALKGSEIYWNVVKVSVYACLLKWVPNSTFKFHFWKSQEKCIFSTFVRPSLNVGPKSSKYHKNRCPCLSLKWVSKIGQKWNSIMRFR